MFFIGHHDIIASAHVSSSWLHCHLSSLLRTIFRPEFVRVSSGFVRVCRGLSVPDSLNTECGWHYNLRSLVSQELAIIVIANNISIKTSGLLFCISLWSPVQDNYSSSLDLRLCHIFYKFPKKIKNISLSYHLARILQNLVTSVAENGDIFESMISPDHSFY